MAELRLRKIRPVSFVDAQAAGQYVRELRLLQGMVAGAEQDMGSLLVQQHNLDTQQPQHDDELKV